MPRSDHSFSTSSPAVTSLRWLSLCTVIMATAPTSARAQLDYTKSPIQYLDATPRDAVSRLQARLDQGEAKVRFDARSGYLRSVLKQLNVPVESQSLVFSKTSLQIRHITPRSPRAIYFADDVYVGYVRGGNIEVSTVDPVVGANFYLLEQQESERPKFLRQTYDCLQCHSSSATRDVPGHLVRSVETGPDGSVQFKAKAYLSDHTSPLNERWGGWYVTGTHGEQRHRGNRFARQGDNVERPDLELGANAADLERWLETSPYPSPHSDIVALLVLEHQTNMHNRLTRANFLARIGAEQEELVARTLEEIAAPVVEHLLFSGEAALTDKIAGTSGYSESFAARGPRDSKGRSLRDFDLEKRLFRYPCSYLIYSELFEGLPAAIKTEVYRQMWKVLTQAEPQADAFRHLSAADRQAILEILLATKPDLPDYWRVRSIVPDTPFDEVRP